MTLEFLDAHEHTRENIKNFNEPMYNYLNQLYLEELLENTCIIFYSDHGHHHDYLYQTSIHERLIEKLLPFLFIVLPYK